MLLHKTNTKPSVPLAYSTDMEECYTTMKTLLERIKYNEHQWRICCDLKIVNILRCIKGGWPKYHCFICDWDTRMDIDHYSYRGWINRKEGYCRKLGMTDKPLVPINKIILPPLHIKLGIVSKFIQAVAERDVVYEQLRTVFPHLSETKIRAGINYI